MERELTGLEQRLYKFLDDIDDIVEFDCTPGRWELIRDKMRRCKEDCMVMYGVINNGYSLHIKLPFDVNQHMRNAMDEMRKCTFETTNA